MAVSSGSGADAHRGTAQATLDEESRMAGDELFEELAKDTSNFAKELNAAGRLWFTRRLLAHLRGLSPPPADVRARAIELLDKAKQQAGACVAAQRAEAETTLAVELIDLAATAAYGAMGIYPAVLLTGDQTAFLKFIVRRRVRAVDRMSVNVNDSQSFAYPPDGDLLRQRPSAQALPSWEGISQAPNPPKRYPFVLSSTGTQDPAAAVDRLFAPNPKRADRSTFDCAAAAMVVHTAALLEAAANPATLGAALVDEGRRYLAIDHPHGAGAIVDGTLEQGVTPFLLEPTGGGDHAQVRVAFPWYTPAAAATPVPPFSALLVGADFEQPIQVEAVEKTAAGFTGRITIAHLDRSFGAGARFVYAGHPDYHLTTDRRSDSALFEQAFVAHDELQVGDHVYVTSHPLHRQFLQDASPWGGEHAFVCAAPVTRRDQTVISGHGIDPMTLRQAVDSKLLVDTNAFLAILRAVLVRQLAGPPAGALQWTGPVGQLTNQASFTAQLRTMYQEPPTAPVTGTCKVYEFDGVRFRRDDSPDTLTSARYQTLTFEGTVGAATVDAKAFILYRGLPPTPPAPQDWSTSNVLIERNDALDPTLPEPARYGLYYFDDVHGRTHQFISLYYTSEARRCGERHLSYDDLEDIAASAGMADRMFVIRPRVPTDPAEYDAYVAALTEKGALPAPP
jgi:hypothetical protein